MRPFFIIKYQGLSHNIPYQNTPAIESELFYFLDTFNEYPTTKINRYDAVEIIKILDIALEDFIKY